MLFKLFILLGAGVLAVALRSFQSSFSQKAVATAILVVSYLLVYFATDSNVLGAVSAAACFFLPLLDILTCIRTLRMPTTKHSSSKSMSPLATCPAPHDIIHVSV